MAAVVLSTPDLVVLEEVVAALDAWQSDVGPFQLHSGDIGWFWRSGGVASAASIRLWHRDGEALAVGLLDEPTILRLAISPAAQQDPHLAGRLLDDVDTPAHGVLPAGRASVEAPNGALLLDLLRNRGWADDERRTPLVRDLSEPVQASGLRIVVVGPEQAPERTAVQRASFERPTFTEESWLAMAAGVPYRRARCLVGYDGEGNGVAGATVWSAGEGRPGLIEPMGVHRDHRRRGHGRAICLAAAAALRELGSSCAGVATQHQCRRSGDLRVGGLPPAGREAGPSEGRRALNGAGGWLLLGHPTALSGRSAWRLPVEPWRAAARGGRLGLARSAGTGVA